MRAALIAAMVQGHSTRGGKGKEGGGKGKAGGGRGRQGEKGCTGEKAKRGPGGRQGGRAVNPQRQPMRRAARMESDRTA